MAAIGAQMYIGNYDYIDVSFIHKREILGGRVLLPLDLSSLEIKLAVLPLLFLIEFYLKGAKEIENNN
jgi:hypothetical protein